MTRVYVNSLDRRLDIDGHDIARDTIMYSISQYSGEQPTIEVELTAGPLLAEFDGAKVELAPNTRDALAALGWAEPVTDPEYLDHLAREAAETESECLFGVVPSGSSWYSTITDGVVYWARIGGMGIAPVRSYVLTSNSPVRVWLP